MVTPRRSGMSPHLIGCLQDLKSWERAGYVDDWANVTEPLEPHSPIAIEDLELDITILALSGLFRQSAEYFMTMLQTNQLNLLPGTALQVVQWLAFAFSAISTLAVSNMLSSQGIGGSAAKSVSTSAAGGAPPPPPPM
ncbi:hypothetical protein EJ05DRAFT_503100 [Pseudovirgaria hyperparasitica]|uniref:Uncharacterized protein n=1 Tax=Pseudovirgaria hyperparasitica TaxID=470096 RepID=A0A6A6W135_9PEZI|nr:uncharacterized protein EJ05DRAFT_503100 [Pseudovirgaria hyperparasitica]KAF2755640.1 hypothetical protein EJ05DRAFT_503100 [Pseudovirgaria hyperparasitica]